MRQDGIFFQIKNLEKTILRKLEPTSEEKEKFSNIVKCPTPTQMQIVGYILERMEKDVYQKDLEKVLNLRRATVSDVLKRMEKNGLIKRDISEYDIRSKKIVLSSDAKELFLTGSNKMKKLEEKALSDISDEELKIFSNVINKIIKNID